MTLKQEKRQKKKEKKKDAVIYIYATEVFRYHIFAMVSLPLQRTAAKIKIGATSSTFCLL